MENEFLTSDEPSVSCNNCNDMPHEDDDISLWRRIADNLYCPECVEHAKNKSNRLGKVRASVVSKLLDVSTHPERKGRAKSSDSERIRLSLDGGLFDIDDKHIVPEKERGRVSVRIIRKRKLKKTSLWVIVAFCFVAILMVCLSSMSLI